mgnify:CR=1 FL=1
MKVVSPKNSNVGYFLKKNKLFFAMMVEGQLDLSTARQFDFLDDNADWEEGMTAVDILKSNHPSFGDENE